MLKIKFDLQFHIHIHRDIQKTPPVTPSLPTAATRLTDYAQRIIRQAREAGQFSTVRNYCTALRSFQAFHPDPGLRLQDITPALIAAYERWLKSRRLAMGTLSCYLRSLRALYNKAVEEQLVADRRPFRRSYTGYPPTEKRSIAPDEIRKLKELPLKSGSYLQLVRDIFLFCLFACGMPFVDVAFLRKSQISSDGYLTYRRRKTHQEIRMKLLPCAQEIVRRYQTTDSDYVFPLLTETEPAAAYRQYKEKLCYHNKLLKELGRRAGITRRLSSYVSRHSWASLAYDTDTEVSVISKGLGHTSPRTTMIYIKGIDDERLDAANRKIADKILRAGPKKQTKGKGRSGESVTTSVQEVGQKPYI